MATASYVRGSFLGGEWSKFAQGRYDLPNYATALNVCFNALPVETGQWVRRPGTRFVAQTWLGHTGRLLSFAFKENVPYTIEITAGVMRLIASSTAPSGFSAITTNDSQSVVSISTANPAKVKTSGSHGWTTGQHVRFDDIGAALIELQNRECIITVTSVTEFTLQDQVSGLGIDGSVLGPVPTGALVSRLVATATPWGAPGTATDLTLVRKVQAETTAILLHPAVKPQGLNVTTPPGTTTPPPNGPFAVFNLANVSFVDGPYLDPYLATAVTPSGTSGSITLQTSASPFVGNAFPGFVASDVGRQIRLFSQPPAWIPGHSYSVNDVISIYNANPSQPTATLYYLCIQATSTAGPGSAPTFWAQVTGVQYATWTWAVITAVNSSSNVTVTVSGTALLYSVVIYAWRMGAYGGTNGYPGCGVYHTGSGRLWLGGAIDNRFDASVSNGIDSSSGTTVINFAPTAADGTVGASNAITGVCNADDVNPILWMASHQQGVLAGTLSGEWLFLAPSAGSIAPNNIDVNRLTTIGGLNTEVRRGEHTLLFVQKYGRKVVEYFADVFSGKFAAPSVTWLSKHLTKGGIQEIAYQQELVPTIWARVANGLVGWVYKRDSLTSAQPPTIAAGHRHALGSGRSIESITTGPSTGGTTDSLMMITNDPVTGVRYVEVLSDMSEEGATLLDAQYVDCAIAAFYVVLQAGPGLPYGGMAFSGLFPLNGKTVTAWIGGLDCGDYLVAGGAVTVPFGDSISAGTGHGLLTEDYVGSLGARIPVWFGFTYTSQGQLVRPNSPQETGARNGPGFMKLRKTNWFGFQVEGAVNGAISFGTDFASLQPMSINQPNGTPYTVLEQFSGIFRDVGGDSDGFDSMICWEVTRPYPANVIAVGAALETKDI